jgi:hypothetical protein
LSKDIKYSISIGLEFGNRHGRIQKPKQTGAKASNNSTVPLPKKSLDVRDFSLNSSEFLERVKEILAEIPNGSLKTKFFTHSGLGKSPKEFGEKNPKINLFNFSSFWRYAIEKGHHSDLVACLSDKIHYEKMLAEKVDFSKIGEIKSFPLSRESDITVYERSQTEKSESKKTPKAKEGENIVSP